MRYIEKIDYDRNYPFRICDSWGGVACFTTDSLVKLKKEIEEVLKNNKNNA